MHQKSREQAARDQTRARLWRAIVTYCQGTMSHADSSSLASDRQQIVQQN